MLLASKKDIPRAQQRPHACPEEMAAGAMLAMIAQTMLPEAFDHGGWLTGLMTVIGFLAAIFMGTLDEEKRMKSQAGHPRVINAVLDTSFQTQIFSGSQQLSQAAGKNCEIIAQGITDHRHQDGCRNQ